MFVTIWLWLWQMMVMFEHILKWFCTEYKISSPKPIIFGCIFSCSWIIMGTCTGGWSSSLMGKGKLLAFGVWLEVSLTEACKKRNEAKLILKSVNDPSVKKKNQKLNGHIIQNNNFGFQLRLVTPSPVIASLILHSQTLSTTIFIKNRVKIRFIENLCFSP